MRALLMEHLSSCGYRVHDAAGIGAAMAQLGAGRPDLVICDLSVPDGTGLHVLRMLRSRGGPQPKLVLITALGDRSSLAEALGGQGSAYLTTPFKMSSLRETVRDALAAS